jgi:hypothetical protein
VTPPCRGRDLRKSCSAVWKRLRPKHRGLGASVPWAMDRVQQSADYSVPLPSHRSAQLAQLERAQDVCREIDRGMHCHVFDSARVPTREVDYGTARCDDHMSLQERQPSARTAYREPGIRCLGRAISPPSSTTGFCSILCSCNAGTRSCRKARKQPARRPPHDASRMHGYFSVPTR